MVRDFFMLVFIVAMAAGCKKETADTEPETTDPEVTDPDDSDTFTNPLMPRGADPWVIQKDGTYYYTYTQGSKLVLYVTQEMSELDQANPIDIWIPPTGTMYSKNIWAPELHEIDGKWYMYFAADNGSNANHRMYVIENESSSPLRGAWELKGKITVPGDEWAIDGTVLPYNDQLYFLWSGSNRGAAPQKIYIAKMSNPWTIEGDRMELTAPEYTWETQNSAVNEGPQPLVGPDGKVFVVYSASHFSSDQYALGLLSLTEGGDPMKKEDWSKHSEPVFSMHAEHGAFGPGHNGFFKSPDGTEDWIIYHARNLPNGGSTNYRNPRIQGFTWRADGTPDFGVPVKIGAEIEKPSGE